RELVAACVSAGYAKIHLDASMPLGGDATSPLGGLAPEVAAEREAELAQAAEAAFREHAKSHPDASPPVYVIGTEVPAPGGVTSGSHGVEVTPAAELRNTVTLCREAFHHHGLTMAWDRVIACVAQPGVEYGDSSVHRYNREKAGDLCKAARAMEGMVIEGHSTDYQPSSSLRQLVQDGVAILKVGPALTFAMRECLFSLERMERELAPLRGFQQLSDLPDTLDRAMRENPGSWKDYYTGSHAQVRFSRAYSFSDRCRYYWTVPAVQESVATLFRNLAGPDIPLSLVSQHLPHLYPRLGVGRLAAEPLALVRESICLVLEDYAAATGR
ncbi:MAG TPA: class II D-tagatose-bisphosphate aldolase, non-catalytic subunit, partial [Spirochaetia bacterium]|nr:class II D-tagatose-bisphosphate aldolase, non-catalytic subunit [Spirochaetia bacterium]